MADTPEEPAAGPQESDQQKKPAGPPEVDAEIVEDGYRQPQATTPTPTSSSETKKDSEEAADKVPPKAVPRFSLKGPFGLSPGVMLLVVLVIVLVIGFAIWRLAGAPAKTETPVESTSSASAPAETAPPSPAPASQSPTAPASSEPSASALQPEAPGPDKIANTGASVAKGAAAGLDPAVTSPSSRGLPSAPPPSAGGNEALQSAAKNAAKMLSGADTGDAIDLGAPAPAEEHAAEAADIAPAPEPSEENEAAYTSEPPASLPASEKIANELDEVKSALAEARLRNAQQADEIAAMRDSFQQALLERDRQAGAAIANLSERLDKIQSESQSAPRGREAAASLALVALQRVLDSGAPYQKELDVLARLAPDRPALERLRARAETGAPTLLALKADFPAAARAARAAAARANAKGPFAAFLARLEALVSIRPAIPVAGSNTVAIISRAEDRLDKDMLEASIVELESLQPPAADAFNAWVADARARLAANQAITDLNAALLADFTE